MPAFDTRFPGALADANENRDWRIYADFAQVLIGHARKLYSQDDFGVQLEETAEETAYVFDSSTIDLCLSLFPWARFRQRKAAIKLHTLMDLRGNIPCFIRITEGKTHDVGLLDELILEPDAFYIMDCGYIDFARLHTFTQQAAFLSSAPNAIWIILGVGRSQSTKAPACAATRPSYCTDPGPHKTTPMSCAASATSTSRRRSGSFFSPTISSFPP